MTPLYRVWANTAGQASKRKGCRVFFSEVVIWNSTVWDEMNHPSIQQPWHCMQGWAREQWDHSDPFCHTSVLIQTNTIIRESKDPGDRHQIQLSVLQSRTWFGLVLFLMAQGCSAITEPPWRALQYRERRHHLGEAQVWHSFLLLPLPSPRQRCSGHFLQHYSPRFRTSLEPQTSLRGQWKPNFCCTQRQQRRVPSNCWSQGRVPQVSPKQRRGGLPLNLQRTLKSFLLRLCIVVKGSERLFYYL